MARRCISNAERSAIVLAWGKRCAYCDKKDGPFEVEHIIPKSRGGSCLLENLCLSCIICNRKKKDTLLPKMYEGILLGRAKRKAKRICEIVSNHRIITYESAQEAVFGSSYVKKYLVIKERSILGNTHEVTQDDLRRYEVRIQRELSLRNLNRDGTPIQDAGVMPNDE